MSTSTTVQPKIGQNAENNQLQITRLVESGADAEAATMLIHRVTGGSTPSDKYEAAAVKSFTDLIVEFHRSGGRLTSVS
jgi:hypothetical protein